MDTTTATTHTTTQEVIVDFNTSKLAAEPRRKRTDADRERLLRIGRALDERTCHNCRLSWARYDKPCFDHDIRPAR